jgi:hypothetical protein
MRLIHVTYIAMLEEAKAQRHKVKKNWFVCDESLR